jgi:hypothetical protein
MPFLLSGAGTSGDNWGLATGILSEPWYNTRGNWADGTIIRGLIEGMERELICNAIVVVMDTSSRVVDAVVVSGWKLVSSWIILGWLPGNNAWNSTRWAAS